MTLNELLAEWLNRSDKQRVAGRYWASDIYKIRKGYLTPKTFFQKKKIEGDGIGLVSQGIAGEDYISRILTDKKVDFTGQASFEIKVGEGIVVSGKADFLFKDKLFEAKAPKYPLDCIPERYLDQLEANYRAFKVPVYLLEIGFNPFSLTPWQYQPDDKRWEEIIWFVSMFHENLKRYTCTTQK